MPNDYLKSNESIGDLIAARCKAVGVSVNEVCKDAGVASYKVSQWKRHNPASIQALRKIEAVLSERESKARADRQFSDDPVPKYERIEDIPIGPVLSINCPAMKWHGFGFADKSTIAGHISLYVQDGQMLVVNQDTLDAGSVVVYPV